MNWYQKPPDWAFETYVRATVLERLRLPSEFLEGWRDHLKQMRSEEPTPETYLARLRRDAERMFERNQFNQADDPEFDHLEEPPDDYESPSYRGP